MKFMLLLCIGLSLFAKDYRSILSKQQIENLRFAEKIGREYKIAGFGNFAKTLPAIVLTESSGGKKMIGDSYFTNRKEKNFLLRSLGLCHVKLATAYETIKKTGLKDNPEYSRFLHKDQFAFKKYTVLLSKITFYQLMLDKNRGHKYYKKFKKRLITYSHQMNKYEKMYHSDTEMAQALLLNREVNLRITMEYFIRNYKLAKCRHYKNPYRSAISMHNGGWTNVAYINAVRKNMKYLKKIKFYK